MRIQKGRKVYRIRHAQILLRLDQIPENAEWTYGRIQAAYSAAHGTIAGVAKRFVFEVEWCIPEANAEFVSKMEDVLDVCQRPCDPLNPVVCIDETNEQLIKETRIPCAPGQPKKVDSEYERTNYATL